MKDDYVGALLEDIQRKLDFLIEAVSSLAVLPSQVKLLDDRLSNLESEFKIIKQVVIENTQDIRQLKQAISL